MNIMDAVQKLVQKELDNTMFLATVTANDGNQVFIKRVGATVPDTQSYAKLAGLTVAVTDVVIVLRVSGGLIVLGKVTHN